MSAISIKLINPPAYITRLFQVSTFGPVYLDIDDQFRIRFTKVLEELTEANQLRQSAALSQSIPVTPKNALILQRFRSHVRNRDTDSLRVEVRHAGRVIPVDRLTVVDWKDRSKRIEIELFGGGWITDMEDLALNDIPLPDFEYTQANVEATWADQTALAVAAIAHYGKWRTPGDVTREDCRFWFNLFKLMEAALCSKGWVFKSPYYESQTGAPIYGYLSDEKWFSYGNDKNHQFRVDTEIKPVRNLSGAPNVLFDEVSDPFDLYNNLLAPGAYLYPPAGEDTEFRINIVNMTITLEPHDPSTSGEWFMVIAKQNSAVNLQFLDSEVRQGRSDQAVTFTINKTIIDEECIPGTRYTFLFGYQEPDNSPLDWSIECDDIDFIPDLPYLVPDDTIPLASLLPDTITAADLYKAMSHLIAGKTKTDFVTREVTLFSSYDTQQLGESIEGFFRRNSPAIDATHLVQPNSREETYKAKERNRFVELKFKDSNDAYITDVATFPREFNRTIDLEIGKAQTTDLENPVFEPTNEAQVDPVDVGGGAEGITLVHLWEHASGDQVSYKLGPRIAYHYGLVEQIDDITLRTFTWEGGSRSSFGYLSQTGEAPLVGDPDRVPLAFAEYATDLYRQHYARWLLEQFSDFDIEFLLWLNYNEFQTLDFRKMLLIHYENAPLLYQVIAISDYDPGQNSSTPVKMKLLEC